MKCNKCNQENAVGAKFCSACGNALAQSQMPQSASMVPSTTVAPTMSGSFNNLNAVAQTKRNPAHVVMIIECIVGTLFVVGLVGLVFWLVLGRSSGESQLSCSEDTKAVTSAVAITYEKDKVTKFEVTYIIDKTVDTDNLRGKDENAYMTAAFASMALSEYDGKKGVDYKYSDRETITTISLVADLTKMDKDDAEELTDSLIENSTLDENKAAFTEAGYICEVK